MRILIMNIMAEYVCSTCDTSTAKRRRVFSEDLPEDWECPARGDGKDVFELK